MTALRNAMIKKDKTISHNLRQFLATTMLANYLTNVTTITGTFGELINSMIEGGGGGGCPATFRDLLYQVDQSIVQKHVDLFLVLTHSVTGRTQSYLKVQLSETTLSQ